MYRSHNIVRVIISPDIIKTIKISKLRWTGHIMRIPKENPGRSKRRWLDGVEEDLRTLDIRGWRRRVLDRDRWKEVLTAARALKGL